MSNRTQRHLKIREIIRNNTVTSQDQLLQLLKDHEYELTQATLSRDIKSLQIGKHATPGGGYAYYLSEEMSGGVVNQPAEDHGVNYLSDGVVSIEQSGTIVVIKTYPAYAGSIAAIIDRGNLYEILGTIAGDDTIMVIVREGVSRRDFIVLLKHLMPKLEGKGF